MALAVSRISLGGIFTQGLVGHAASSRVATSTLLHHGPPIATRRNASTTAGTMTRKGPVTAKSTAKAAHTTPPSPQRKAATKKPRAKTTSPEMEKALHTAERFPSRKLVEEQDKKKYDEMSPEDQKKELDRMMALSELMPTVDPWGGEIDQSLDVVLPKLQGVPLREIGLSRWREIPSLLLESFRNDAKNSVALSSLARIDCVPGVLLGYLNWAQQLRMNFKVFHTQSVKRNGLLAPFRQFALELYEELNNAVARRNERDIKKLTTSSYQSTALGLANASMKRNPKGRLIWQLHRIVDPVQVISLRAAEGYAGSVEPRHGNRLMIHALVKFNTEQSLEMYDAHGRALHVPLSKEETLEAEDKWRVPAQRRIVTEYLVLEKKMWVKGPWVFREQIWPANVTTPKKSKGKNDGEKKSRSWFGWW